MSSQTIRRARRDKDNPYKAIRRATFEDANLSFEARGVLGYILVKPDDWEVQVTDLMRQGDIGRDKAYRIINELIAAGYCKRVEYRTRGRIIGYTYLIDEEPVFLDEATREPLPENTEADDYTQPLPDLPLTVEPLTVEPLTENTDHTNKERLPIKKTATKEEGLTTNQPVVSPLIVAEQVGWFLDSTGNDGEKLSVLVEETNSNSTPDIQPIVANGDPKSLSAPPCLPPAQALAYHFLADPEVSATAYDRATHESLVRAWAATEDPIWLIRHLAVWWDDHYRRKTANSFGALKSRIARHCDPNPWPDSFLASAFYRRHYPLDHQAAQARDRAIVYTPHLVDPDPLLDALPAPLWDE